MGNNISRKQSKQDQRVSERSGGRPGYANTRRAEKAREAFSVSEEPKKDSASKRVNLDNARVTDPRIAAFIKGMSMKDANDVSWYNKNKEMYAAATSFPSSDIVGAPMLRFRTSRYVPGICTLLWDQHLEGRALTQAMDSMYTFTIHANSRNYSYTAPDQMVMILAAANCFAAIANYIRVYGVMKHYNPLNEYLARELVTALGFNFDDLKENLGNMWFDINQMIAACEQFWIPDNMPIIERWYWMNSNLYTDANSPKAQIYAFVPQSLFYYEESEETGSALKRDARWKPNIYYDTIRTTGASYSLVIGQNSIPVCTSATYSDIVWNMIGKLAASEDRGMILGDLLNAYGAQRIYKLDSVPADYTVTPVYNAEVLTQIENAMCFPTMSNALVQNPASGVSKLQVQYVMMPKKFAGRVKDKQAVSVLNFHQMSAPTGDQIMVATRLKYSGVRVITSQSSTEDTGLIGLGPDVAGTEYISAVGFAVLGANGLEIIYSDLNMTAASEVTNVAASLMHAWGAFDWCPWLYACDMSSNPDYTTPGSRSNSNVVQAFGDYDWFTVIDQDELNKLHVTALYSLVGQPESI